MNQNRLKPSLRELDNVPVYEWQKVAEYYLRTNAVLECRMIKISGTNMDFYNSSRLDSFNLKVESLEYPKEGAGVPALCGTLTSPQGVLPGTFSWDPKIFSWTAPSGIYHIQVLCGNVLSYTPNVLDEISDIKPPKFSQWNRFDAPKDQLGRVWLQ